MVCCTLLLVIFLNPFDAAILILERGCVRSTSRSNERTRKCWGFAEMLRLVETTQSRSGAKMRIAAFDVSGKLRALP